MVHKMATEHAKQAKPNPAKKFTWSGKTAAPAALIILLALPSDAGVDLRRLGQLTHAWPAVGRGDRARMDQQ